MNEGVRVVIAGRPNAGKSSLLNALLGRKRAIVTDIPGTTRDIIEDSIIISGIPVRLSDTAGLRETVDVIEAEGVRLAIEAVNDSDICLYIVDGSQEITQEDVKYIRGLEGRKALIVLSKSDLEDRAGEIDTSCRKIHVSSKTQEGINELKSAIYDMAAKNAVISSGLNVSAGQLDDIRGALSAMKEAEISAASSLGEDVTAGLMNSARLLLLRVLGIDAGDELLDSMFRRFCVGK